MTVVVDIERGEVRFGGRQVRIERTAQPHRFRLAEGGIVRAISFGERGRVLREALAADDPAQTLIDLLRGLALEGAPDDVATAVLLALAGGGERAPEFDQCAVEACRARGWDWRTLNETTAIDVDRSVQPSSDGSWTRIEFAQREAADADEIAQAIAEMTEQLLDRAAPGAESAGFSPHKDGELPGPVSVPEDWPAPAARPEPQVVEPPAESLAESAGREWGDLPAAVSDFSWPGSNAPVANKMPAATPPSPVIARARFRLQPNRPAAKAPVRWRAAVQPAVAPASFDRVQHATPATGRATSPAVITNAPSISTALSDLPIAAPIESIWPEQPRVPATPAPNPKPAPQPTDWLDDIARALADECDLRGLD